MQTHIAKNSTVIHSRQCIVQIALYQCKEVLLQSLSPTIAKRVRKHETIDHALVGLEKHYLLYTPEMKKAFNSFLKLDTFILLYCTCNNR
jgi:hypothetical protein